MKRRSVSILLVLGAVLALSGIGAAEEPKPAEVFNAFAVSMQAGGGAAIEIVINRWSTDDERNRVLAALRQDGADKAVQAVRREYSVGQMHWANGLEYTLDPGLTSIDSVDTTLFDSKKGFCGHFASAYANMSSGMRCAETTRHSWTTPNSARMAAACCKVSQSLDEPISTPTTGGSMDDTVSRENPKGLAL